MCVCLANFTKAAKNALNLATSTAQTLGYSFIGTQHLLIGLMKSKNSVAGLILNSTLNKNQIEPQLKLNLLKNSKQKRLTKTNFTPTLNKIINSAVKKAKLMGLKTVGTQQLLLEFLKHEKSYGVEMLKNIDSLIESNLFAKSLACNYNNLVNSSELTQTKTKHNKFLKQFGKNLTRLARLNQLDPLIGRTKELERIEQILTRRKKNNPCLIGEPGVGKTAIVEGLALKIIKNDVPKKLQGKQIVELNLSSIIAGTKYRGEFEQRLETILKEVKNNSKIILFLDEIHTIVNAGAAQGAIDAANILKPSMARGDIQLIGTTTKQEFKNMIQIDPALERRLQPISVYEPSLVETFNIILGIKENYEQFHQITISEQAIKTAITLSKANFKHMFLPDIAIDLIDEAAAKKNLNNQQKKLKSSVLTSFDVANLVKQKLN